MAFGTGPFGLSRFGTSSATVADQDITTLTSSRSQLANGQYEINEDGGFVGMNDTLSRVWNLSLFGMGPRPKYIDGRSLAELESRMRAALRPLTKQPTPDITNLQITARDVGGGQVEITVDFTDARTNSRTTASKTL